MLPVVLPAIPIRGSEAALALKVHAARNPWTEPLGAGRVVGSDLGIGLAARPLISISRAEQGRSRVGQRE
jgi:hypothetical protein